MQYARTTYLFYNIRRKIIIVVIERNPAFARISKYTRLYCTLISHEPRQSTLTSRQRIDIVGIWYIENQYCNFFVSQRFAITILFDSITGTSTRAAPYAAYKLSPIAKMASGSIFKRIFHSINFEIMVFSSIVGKNTVYDRYLSFFYTLSSSQWFFPRKFQFGGFFRETDFSQIRECFAEQRKDVIYYGGGVHAAKHERCIGIGWFFPTVVSLSLFSNYWLEYRRCWGQRRKIHF